MNAAYPQRENETRLVIQAQKGDQDALRRLVELHWAGVVNVAYRMCGDAHLAEDAAQEAFIRAWRSLGSFRAGSPLRPWLYRIALNAALDALRKRKPQANLEALPLTAGGGDPSGLAEAHERRWMVQQAVLALPEASRTALVLREYEGLSYAEIAQALEIPIGTVMSRLSYARAQLAKALRSYLEED
jgi:RNA polymerase sigma-70 factor (ECF subfamily)